MKNESAQLLRVAVMRLARRIRVERVDGSMGEGMLSALGSLAAAGTASLRELSEAERVSPPSMNRTVNALQLRGLLTRTTSPTDARRVSLEVTDAGHALLRDTRKKRDEWFTARLDTLTPEEQAQLEASIELMRRLANG
jgi:DNA-binding MarR family transcriptional regulator